MHPRLEADMIYRYYANPSVSVEWLDGQNKSLPLASCDVQSSHDCLCAGRGLPLGCAIQQRALCVCSRIPNNTCILA